MDLVSALRSIGFFAVEDGLSDLNDRLQRMARDAGDLTVSDRFEKLVSYIPAEASPPRAPALILIDIGGTSTKVGVRRLIDGATPPDWLVLFEDPNDDFNEPGHSGTGLERFAQSVALRTAKSLEKVGISPGGKWGLGIIWSNAMVNERDPSLGIVGTIVNRDRYTKDEWFNRDARDGDNVSQVFLDAFRYVGFAVEVSVIANDTPFTMKALNEADGGMVASTGVNATLVDTVGGERVICNAEMGTTCVMDESVFSSGDIIFPGKRPEVIEHQLSGRFLPQIFAGHVLALGKSGLSPLDALAGHLHEMGENAYTKFETADLSRLLLKPSKFRELHSNLLGPSDGALDLLTQIASYLVKRSAMLSALMAVASVSRQFGEKDCFCIALDSRLAREMPIFWETMEQTVSRCMPNGKSANLVLIDRVPVRNGVLSVPMLGAAHSIDSVYGS